MRKFFTSFLVATLMIMSGINVSLAMTYEEGYAKTKEYYEKLEVLENLDYVIACEALGVESDDKELGEDIISFDSTSNIAKSIIALTLHNDDPRNYNGVNYVEMLESRVHDDGAVYLDGEYLYAGPQVYGVFALYVVGSSKTELAADYLQTLQVENGLFGFPEYEDPDTTGWVIEALTLVNKEKYQETLVKALNAIKSCQNENAGFDNGFGVNACTQACVLMGLLTYDFNGIKNGSYDKGNTTPIDLLLQHQLDDGSFYYMIGDQSMSPFATVQGAQAIGYYFNGSVYEDAKSEYNDIVNPVTNITLNQSEVTLIEGKTVELKASVSPQTANQTIVWNIEDATIASIDDNGVVTAIKEGTTTVSVNSKNGLSAKCVIHVVKEEAKENSKTLDKNKVPETSDSFHILMYVVFMFISGFVVIRRKAFGR